VTARRVGLAIGVVAALAIAVATLMPAAIQPNPGNYDPRCRMCGPLTGVDVIGNILLFLPLGVGLAVAGLTRKAAVRAGAIMSVAIELLQLTVVPGRDPSLIDVASNTLGTFVGVVVGGQWRTLLWPSARASVALAAGAAATYIAIMAAVSWALGPGLPEGSWYLERGIGTPLRPSGRVVDARASREPIIGDTMTNVATVRRELLAGEPVSVTAAIAVGPAQSTSLLQIISPALDNILTIDRRGDDAAFFPRMRASDVRLQRVGVRLPGFFAASTGDTVHLSGRRVGARIEISGQRNGRSAANALLLTPGVGWALFVPVRAGLTTVPIVPGVAWLIVILVPFAYWAACAARRTSNATTWGLTRVVIVAVGAGLVPLAAALAPSRWWEWVAALAALLIGHALASGLRTNTQAAD
jgi:VanZ family protein